MDAASASKQTACEYALRALARNLRFLESPGKVKHGFWKHFDERADVWEAWVPEERERAERMAIISECMESGALEL